MRRLCDLLSCCVYFLSRPLIEPQQHMTVDIHTLKPLRTTRNPSNSYNNNFERGASLKRERVPSGQQLRVLAAPPQCGPIMRYKIA